jgi:protein SCO1/2
MNNDQPNNDQQVEPLELPRNSSSALVPILLCVIVVLIGISYLGWTWWKVREFQAEKSNAILANAIGPPLTEFELTERSGEPFRSADMRGRVWVASYFYTSCPGQCIRLNTNIQGLSQLPELKDVTWVSITCDPDHDSLDALKKYAERFEADPQRWLFCRADLPYTQRVAKGMKLFLSLRGHQDYAIVIDKEGKVRGMFDGTSDIEKQRLKHLLLECLAEKPPADLVATPAKKEKSS